MYVMLRLVEERGEGVCVHVFIHWQQATILWLCKLKNDTVFKKKSFFLILFTYKISKFSILIKPTLWSVKVWSLKILKNILFPISKKCVIISCRSIGLKKIFIWNLQTRGYWPAANHCWCLLQNSNHAVKQQSYLFTKFSHFFTSSLKPLG